MPTISIGKRITNLQARLLDIRLGSGAIVLPKTIKRIHLRFAPHINGGHMGSRKFWRHEMIRMKYHNPAVTMTVDNKAPQTDRAIMSIHFVPEGSKQTSESALSSPAAVDTTTSASTPSDAAATTRVETIDMTGSTNSEILAALMKLTKATSIEPTASDIAEQEELKVEQARSARDSKRGQAHRAAQKREQELLEQARTGLV